MGLFIATVVDCIILFCSQEPLFLFFYLLAGGVAWTCRRLRSPLSPGATWRWKVVPPAIRTARFGLEAAEPGTGERLGPTWVELNIIYTDRQEKQVDQLQVTVGSTASPRSPACWSGGGAEEGYRHAGHWPRHERGPTGEDQEKTSKSKTLCFYWFPCLLPVCSTRFQLLRCSLSNREASTSRCCRRKRPSLNTIN